MALFVASDIVCAAIHALNVVVMKSFSLLFFMYFIVLRFALLRDINITKKKHPFNNVAIFILQSLLFSSKYLLCCFNVSL